MSQNKVAIIGSLAPEKIEVIARMCHEAVRIHNEFLGKTGEKAWSKLTKDEKDAVIGIVAGRAVVPVDIATDDIPGRIATGILDAFTNKVVSLNPEVTGCEDCIYMLPEEDLTFASRPPIRVTIDRGRQSGTRLTVHEGDAVVFSCGVDISSRFEGGPLRSGVIGDLPMVEHEAFKQKEDK